MKGVLLAGGTGSRLLPDTRSVSKQLLTVYDKPMIYYSHSILMLSDITEIAVITTIEGASLYRELLRDGSSFGINIVYIVQDNPNALLDAANFIRSIQSQHNYIVACLEKIAYQKKWIGIDQLRASAKAHGKTGYGEYLAQLAET